MGFQIGQPSRSEMTKKERSKQTSKSADTKAKDKKILPRGAKPVAEKGGVRPVRDTFPPPPPPKKDKSKG